MTTCLFKQFARYYSPSWKTPQLESLVKKIKDHFVTKKKISQTQSSEIHANDEVTKPIEILSSIRKYALDHPERNHPIVISIACYLARELANGTRGILSLPHPIDQTSKILAFVPTEMESRAKAAGASIVGGAELIPQIIEGKLEFNRCVATKNMIPVITKIARYLGPKGLMPTIKTGTLTDDIENAIKSSIDKIPFRIAKNGLMNSLIARTSFSNEQILENFNAIMKHLECFSSNAKKGKFVRMGRLGIPSDKLYKVDLKDYYIHTGKREKKITDTTATEENHVMKPTKLKIEAS